MPQLEVEVEAAVTVLDPAELRGGRGADVTQRTPLATVMTTVVAVAVAAV